MFCDIVSLLAATINTLSESTYYIQERVGKPHSFIKTYPFVTDNNDSTYSQTLQMPKGYGLEQ